MHDRPGDVQAEGNCCVIPGRLIRKRVGQSHWNGIVAKAQAAPSRRRGDSSRLFVETDMSMFNKVSKTFQWGHHQVTMETGEIARQASGAVMVSVEDTVILATVVARKDAKPGQDFFPLTVDYVEKTYAAGRIPGGFFKREGRPSEKETLTSRLIDRPIRPLFPEGYLNEVQVIIHVLSVNPEIDPDIPAMIGASAALCIAGIPFNGPIGAARVGYIDGQYVLNPNVSQLAGSKMDLVVAGTETAVLMVESEAQELSEEIMLGAEPERESGEHEPDGGDAWDVECGERILVPDDERFDGGRVGESGQQRSGDFDAVGCRDGEFEHDGADTWRRHI